MRASHDSRVGLCGKYGNGKARSLALTLLQQAPLQCKENKSVS